MSRTLSRAWIVSILAVPCVAYADALPPDPQDIYYHCTPAEQCPTGSETCATIRGPAGHTSPDADCARAAEAKGLENRCSGRGGYLFCPKGATGSWKPGDPPTTSRARKGCS